jgi:predicted nuclease of predicted toxin-antitoxin system
VLRLLADENVPGPIVRALRDAGHDVLWMRDSGPGAADAEVMALAQREMRVLLTFDKDFGELAFKARLSADSGIILFRLSGSSPSADCARVLALFDGDTDWRGHFAVVTDELVRTRPLPPEARADAGGPA